MKSFEQARALRRYRIDRLAEQVAAGRAAPPPSDVCATCEGALRVDTQHCFVSQHHADTPPTYTRWHYGCPAPALP